MTRPFPRHVVLALCLLPVLWLAVRWAEFKTDVEIQCTDSTVRFVLNGQSIEAPLNVGHVREISIVASHSFFRMGAEEITFRRPNGELLETLRPPHRFRFPVSDTNPLAGDWWIDEQPVRAEVYRNWVSLDPPFVMRTKIIDRGMQNLEMHLEGDVNVACVFRTGWLNNDMYFADEAAMTTRATGIAAILKVDGRHALYWFFSGLFFAALLVVIFHAIAWFGRRAPRSNPWKISWRAVFLMVLGFSVALFFWMGYSVLDARPHFQDDLGYLLRAKWLLAGHLFYPKPENADHFAVPFTTFLENRWISQYPIGWPALLALGELADVAWLVSPLCGVAAVWIVWRLGREISGGAVGVMAAALLTLSPLAIILSGSMMSHAAQAMWLALFVWLFIRGWRGKGHWRTLALAGIALGFAFATRPLSGFAVAVPAGIFVATELFRRRFASGAWLLVLALFAGGLLGALPALIDNWQVTGSPLIFAYKAAYPKIWRLDAYPFGLFWTDRTMALVPAVAFGWGWPDLASWWPLMALAFAFAFVPFVAGSATRHDWLLLGVFVSVPIAYIGYNAGTGIHGFGPRYYYDVFFALVLLTARGFHVLAKSGGDWGHSPWPRRLTIALFLVLATSTAWSLPRRLNLYRGYNEVDDRIERWVATLPTKRGLILLEPPAYLNWVRVARMLPSDLRADRVFAWKLDDNTALLRAYEGWPVYEVDDNRLRPYTAPP